MVKGYDHMILVGWFSLQSTLILLNCIFKCLFSSRYLVSTHHQTQLWNNKRIKEIKY
ncbi:uncharacterized protein DS421_13g391490 [Arachis hypogaea]|nr:uncharacterized protein DS421_13g391490 [Arachis hypogaea]